MAYRHPRCMAPQTERSGMSRHRGLTWYVWTQCQSEGSAIYKHLLWPHHRGMDSEDCLEQFPGILGSRCELKLCMSCWGLQVRAQCTETLCEVFELLTRSNPEVMSFSQQIGVIRGREDTEVGFPDLNCCCLLLHKDTSEKKGWSSGLFYLRYWLSVQNLWRRNQSEES